MTGTRLMLAGDGPMMGGRMSGSSMGQPDGQVALPLRRDGQELVPGFAFSPGFLNEGVGGSAMEGLDFSIPQEELTFYPNDLITTATITLIDDFVLDGPETFYVDLVTSGTIRPMPGHSRATVTLTDGTPSMRIFV